MTLNADGTSFSQISLESIVKGCMGETGFGRMFDRLAGCSDIDSGKPLFVPKPEERAA